MRDFSAKRLLTATLVCAATAAVAQNGNSNKENDPYSRYGIGESLTGTNVLNRGMGYTSVAYQNASAVNTENPASYSFLKITTYEAGFTGGLRSIHADNKSYNTGSASLAYLRVGLPLGRHAGMAFGLQPQSHVFYHSIDTASIIKEENKGGFVYNKNVSEYTGEGGLNYAFIGGGGEVSGFSFGANFGYMFGNIRNTSRLVNIDTTHVLGSDFSKYTRLGGIHWKAGVQYHDTLQNGWHVRVGATADISQQLNGNRETYNSSFFYIGSTQYTDTAFTTSDERGKIILPSTYAVGAQLGGGNWSLAADVTRMDWSKYRNYDVSDSLVDKTIRINAGGEFTPDPTNVYSYLSRVTYRAGFYYGTDYVKLRNTEMNYYGFTLGASLPFKRMGNDPYSSGMIHAAIEVGRRGTETNGLVQANYFKFHLGVSLNNKWFIKRRYD